MKKYSKAIAAFCTSLAGAITTVAADGRIELPEVMAGVATIIAATFAVFQVTNEPSN